MHILQHHYGSGSFWELHTGYGARISLVLVFTEGSTLLIGVPFLAMEGRHYYNGRILYLVCAAGTGDGSHGLTPARQALYTTKASQGSMTGF